MIFGHCCLCVHPAVEPMATPSGHVYCKECIVEYLLAKTQELKRQREAFEAQAKNEGMFVISSHATLQMVNCACAPHGMGILLLHPLSETLFLRVYIVL